MTGTSGQNWTSAEVDAIVAVYFDMLALDLAGNMFVRADYNRLLQDQTGRSKGAIEYKLQNISAVFERLGLPYVRGYLPARNFQRLLYEAVEARLDATGFEGRLESFDPPLVSLPDLIRVPAPVRTLDEVANDPVIQRVLRKFDPAVRDAGLRKLGRDGEAFLFKAEQIRLSAAGRDDLAAKVRWVSEEDGDGAGYDILSWSRSGEERLLEVKTTRGPISTPFFITENERRVSEERRDAFRLVRLFDFARQPSAFELTPPLTDHLRLMPSVYRAQF